LIKSKIKKILKNWNIEEIDELNVLLLLKERQDFINNLNNFKRHQIPNTNFVLSSKNFDLFVHIYLSSFNPDITNCLYINSDSLLCLIMINLIKT
jgi:hypothetical protein